MRGAQLVVTASRSLSNDVLLHGPEDGQELLLLLGGHLELGERLDQVLDRRVPLRVRDAHARVDGLHVPAQVGAWPAGRIADLVGQLSLELRDLAGVQALEAAVDAGIGRQVGHEVVHDALDRLAATEPLVQRGLGRHIRRRRSAGGERSGHDRHHHRADHHSHRYSSSLRDGLAVDSEEVVHPAGCWEAGCGETLNHPATEGRMNIHENARLTPHGRAEMVQRVLAGARVARVAQGAGVSVRTVQKWLARYRVAPSSGLRDRSCRPHRLPRITPAAQLARIAALRRQRWSIPRIAAAVGVAPSTVGRWVQRWGLGRLPALQPAPPVQRYEWARPGELLHVDVKKLGRWGAWAIASPAIGAAAPGAPGGSTCM